MSEAARVIETPWLNYAEADVNVSVRKRGAGWEYDFRRSGKRYRKARFLTKAEARAAARLRIEAMVRERRLANIAATNAPVIQAPELPGVYAIAGVAGYIKIGKAVNIARRIAELQVGHPVPLRLVAVLSQDVRDEGRLHAMWGHLRSSGEWFRADEELLAFIEARRATAQP